jgi:hypothetical protein
MWFATMVVFSVSLVAVVLLFILKRLEFNREHRFAENLRTRADYGALRVKGWLEVSEWYLERIPFFVGALTRYGVHISALGFARIARSSAQRAHQLADFVSHKRNFERRETKSKFLKDVSEYKNGKSNDDGGVATL